MNNVPITILVVDDQEENIRVVGTVLSSVGYDIAPAMSAEQAFKRMTARQPDLILLDVLMPDVNGLEMCQQLQADERWKEIPVIFLSAADDKNLIVQALEAGGVDYVTKPFNKAELISRVRTQLSLKEARDQLRMLAEDKDEILGILTHDLKNHLAGISLSAGLLQDRVTELTPRCVTLVENIARSSDRMIVFVKEFLANQSAERMQLKPTLVNLGETVEALVVNHQPSASMKRIQLTSSVTPDQVLIQVDGEGLNQVLENLISNAIKFTPEEGTVSIEVESPRGRMARCVIRDSGPGFTPEDRQKMFRRYGRLSARPTGGEPSTGLGLSIVKRLTTAMGGSIALDETGGPGSAFVLMLPLAARDLTAGV